MATEERFSDPIQAFVANSDIEEKLTLLEAHLQAHHWTLIRHLQYYAIAVRDLDKAGPVLSKSGGKRGRRSGNVNAAWGETLRALEPFRKRLNSVSLSCGFFGSPASLRNFALGHVTKVAWKYPRVLVALFIVDQTLQRPDRAMLCKLMRERLPECEIDFLRGLRYSFLDGNNDCPLQSRGNKTEDDRRQVAGHPAPLLSAMNVVHRLPRIQSFMQNRFATDIEASKDFGHYFDSFCAGPKKYLHMICLRGQRSTASSVVASFLAIVPPQSNEFGGEYTFKHIYQIGAGDRPRISQGLVLPLAGGVYLIGGQQSYDKRTTAFITLKIIALPWRAIRSQDLILPGLLMSASRDDQHLVGKVALRPTGATRHDQASIGLKHISELEDYLKQLEPLDTSPSFEGRNRANEGRSSQVARMLHLTNNTVRQWDVVDVFRDSNGIELDRLAFETQIQRAFGRPRDHKYQSRGGVTFTFPDSLWFGPITTDR